MPDAHILVGTPQRRVDGRAKVTGAATYAGGFTAPGLLHGYVVCSATAKDRITHIDTGAALAVSGVVQVFTHLNQPKTACQERSWQDQVGPPGHTFRPLYDEHIHYSGQPIALVVAESSDLARHAASLVRVEYSRDAHETNLDVVRPTAKVPPKTRTGINPPPKPHGNAPAALAEAAVRIEHEYTIAPEHHDAMEPHATTVICDGGVLLVHDKTQGVQNTQAFLAGVFGLSAGKVHVVTPYLGDGFGSGLRPQYQVVLAVMASLGLERSVRVVLTRDQTFTFTYRPQTINTLALGADPDGLLHALAHDAVAGTSQYEDLGSVRVTRVVDAVAASKILNPQTARSQVIGGVVFGIGMALEEESMADHGLGRFMNHNLAGYPIPVNADVPQIEVIFVEEHDEVVSPIGMKGLGEIGIVGTAAAIANAIHHATGKRMRHLTITTDKLLS